MHIIFDNSVELTNQTFQVAPESAETLVEVESSYDSKKTQIFSNHKPEPSPKPRVNKTKGTS